MKKIAILFPLLVGTTFALAGCNDPEPTSSVVTNQIVLNASSVHLGIGETFPLTVLYDDFATYYATEYVSLNTNVVTVSEDGIVTAVAAGETQVEVSKGNAKATCDFVVSLNDQVPCLEVSGIKDHHLALDKTGQFTFDVRVRMGAGYFEPDSVSYEIHPGTGDGRMEGNTFIPTQIGELTLEIKGIFSGNELYSYLIAIEIKDSVIFTLKDKNGTGREFYEVNIFTLDAYKGKAYQNEFTAEVYLSVNGEDKSSEVVLTMENNEGAINYNPADQKIVGVKRGMANLKATYGDYSQDFPIHVNYVNIDDYDLGAIKIDASVGEFPVADIFADFPGEQTLKRAASVDGKTEYEITDNKVLGIESHNLATQQVVLYTDKLACKVTFQAYAKILRTAEDLRVFNLNFGQDTNAIIALQNVHNDGYYLLANDIDCSGVIYSSNTRIIGRAATDAMYLGGSMGFVGTFDGNGHTISNLNVPKEGLFLMLGNGSVVKNVAFKNAILDMSDNDKFVLATYVYSSLIENVFISSSSNVNRQDDAMVAGGISGTARFKNCLFEYTGTMTAVNNFGSLACMAVPHLAQNSLSYESVYMVSTTPLIANRNSNGYYVDSRRFESIEDRFPNFVLLNSITHYLDYAEMQAAGEDFASFDSTYWRNSGGVLEWAN